MPQTQRCHLVIIFHPLPQQGWLLAQQSELCHPQAFCTVQLCVHLQGCACSPTGGQPSPKHRMHQSKKLQHPESKQPYVHTQTGARSRRSRVWAAVPVLPDIPSEGREALSPPTHALPSSSGFLVSPWRKLHISFSLNSLSEGACLALSDNVQSSPRWMQRNAQIPGKASRFLWPWQLRSLQVSFVLRGETKSQSKQRYCFLILPSNTKSTKPGSAFPAYIHSFLAAGAEDL